MSQRRVLTFVIVTVNASSPLIAETAPGRENVNCCALHSIEFFVVVVVVDFKCAADAPAAGPTKTATTTRAAR